MHTTEHVGGGMQHPHREENVDITHNSGARVGTQNQSIERDRYKETSEINLRKQRRIRR